MTVYKQIKGNTYEEFVLNNLLSQYDSIYYFKETPEYIIAKTKLYSNFDIYNKYKNCDIGADLVAIKNDQVYFIQCKNFNNTISINDFCSFYFLILEFELNGIVYYNGVLSERLTDLAQGKIQYNNLPYNNTIIDVEFISNESKNIIPRNYQLEIYNEFKNIDRGIISLPCGMGKTFCSWLIGRDYSNIIIISPTRSLSDSNLVQLYNYSVNTYNPVLISMDGSRDPKYIFNVLKDKNIISSTYDSVDILNIIIKKLDNYVIFIDEYHNLSSNNLEKNSDPICKLINLKNKIIFMSATPIHLDKKYSNIFGNYIYKYNWAKAIELRYICGFKIILPEDNSDTTVFDNFLSNINYSNVDKEQVLKTYFILRGLNYYGSNKTILYSSSTDEALKYSNIIEWMKKIIGIEIEANIIDYKTSKLNRIEYIKKFKTMSPIKQILINVQILNEGIDIPECDSVYITKPNENIINLIQRMSRCNRIVHNKKHCNIYMWAKNSNEIFEHINNFINLKYEIQYVKINKNAIQNYDIVAKKNIDLSKIYKKIIKYNDYNVYVVYHDETNEPYFNAKQVCEMLEYKNYHDALQNNVIKENIYYLKDIVKNYKILYKNAQRQSKYLNKAGLDSIILKSRQKNALEISKWIIENILE